MNMHTVGETLKLARLSNGLDIDNVAKRLYVKSDIIKALEANNFTYIKSPAAIRGLIQNYAKLLGLSPQKILALYRRQAGINHVRLVHIDKPINTKNFEITPVHIALGSLLFVAIMLIIYLITAYIRASKYPTLVMLNPKTNVTKTTEPKFILEGIVEKDTILTINGTKITYDQEGHFKHEIQLRPGENEITIQVIRTYSPDKKTIKKISIIYQKPEPNSSATDNTTSPGPSPISFTVKVISDVAWIQVVADNVQRDIGIKSAGYSKRFTARSSMYILTGRPSVTKVTVNQIPIEWRQVDNTIKIECAIKQAHWVCNDKNL